MENATNKIIESQEGSQVSLPNTAGTDVQITQVSNTQVAMVLFPNALLL